MTAAGTPEWELWSKSAKGNGSSRWVFLLPLEDGIDTQHLVSSLDESETVAMMSPYA